VDDLVGQGALGKKIVEELRSFVKTEGATEDLKRYSVENRRSWLR
ncbi:MAG: hypothetical protein QOF22_2192, partial [Bradyrhizobium sp.]|nr:hypothetical protein [Bradyrhizobium sp.]